MTYEQSLEMIEKLKNTVWPYSEEWGVHFYFTTKTDFEIRFFEMKNWYEYVSNAPGGWNKGMPHAKIWIYDELIFFHYSDDSIFEYSFDLLLNVTYDNMVLSDRFADWEFNRALRTIPGLENFNFKNEK